MSILDDAIREHLELKRAHGADESELKKLEDEAFGPPQRPDEPDPFAEAPTEFLTTPGSEELAGAEGRRPPNITDLQEAPPASEEAPPAPEPVPDDEGPAEEEHPAGEHEAIAEPGPTTEERHAIADQPTEMFDVEAQFEEAPPEADAPSDEQLLDAELGEPRLAPVDPIAGIEASAPEAEAPAEPAPAEDEPADEFDEFFSEQRLSDELNRALEAPLPDEPRPAGTEETTAIFDVEDELHREDAAVEADDDLLPEDGSEQYEIVTDPHGDDEESSDQGDDAPAAQAGEHEEDEHRDPPAAAPAPGHEDLLEDTPDFLQDDPEDDNLWFEQKPPKDIDFGD